MIGEMGHQSAIQTLGLLEQRLVAAFLRRRMVEIADPFSLVRETIESGLEFRGLVLGIIFSPVGSRPIFFDGANQTVDRFFGFSQASEGFVDSESYQRGLGRIR